MNPENLKHNQVLLRREAELCEHRAQLEATIREPPSQGRWLVCRHLTQYLIETLPILIQNTGKGTSLGLSPPGTPPRFRDLF